MATLKLAMRTVDVARRAGYSVQQVRDLERDGVLPPASRTASGYREYGEIHVRSVLAYRALAAGTGPVEAKRIMRRVHQGTTPEALASLDSAHAQLDRERRDLTLAREAAAAISEEPVEDVRPADSMSVAELADALGVRSSTLRHWDAERLVIPDRLRGARRYSPTQVRDARIIHQLRGVGYRIETLRALMSDFPRERKLADIETALAARDDSIATRSRALLDAASALSSVISLVESPARRSPK